MAAEIPRFGQDSVEIRLEIRSIFGQIRLEILTDRAKRPLEHLYETLVLMANRTLVRTLETGKQD